MEPARLCITSDQANAGERTREDASLAQACMLNVDNTGQGLCLASTPSVTVPKVPCYVVHALPVHAHHIIFFAGRGHVHVLHINM